MVLRQRLRRGLAITQVLHWLYKGTCILVPGIETELRQCTGSLQLPRQHETCS
jgi:hypothetical protein